jgi:restriction system protein
MGVWKYEHCGSLEAKEMRSCPYCDNPLIQNDDINSEARRALYTLYSHPDLETFGWVKVCSSCGWWAKSVFGCLAGTLQRQNDIEISAKGVLKKLDPAPNQPLAEVRDYLTARYEDRFDVHPRQFEEVVASVFGDLGFQTQVTGYSNDGGIDVVMNDGSEKTIGVQVKRYRARIAVSQIREFAGAMMIGDFTRGIFVTTSDFQSGATKVASLSAAKGYPIELINATQFYAALKLAQVSTVREIFELKPWTY